MHVCMYTPLLFSFENIYIAMFHSCKMSPGRSHNDDKKQMFSQRKWDERLNGSRKEDNGRIKAHVGDSAN